jgi:hypothetical protein
MKKQSGLAGTGIKTCIAVFAGLAALVHAAPPIEPLPLPCFSFDRQSPTVLQGLVSAADVLTLSPDSFPIPMIPGPALGLLSLQDDLDALSGPNAWLSPAQIFLLRFSVDRQTRGSAPPDAEFINLDVPYNVFDQARRGHAAGDEYMAVQNFTLRDGMRGPGQGNNVLGRNNYDEGGTDFGGQPQTSASQSVPPGTPQDDVDAMGALPSSLSLPGLPEHVYFSATRDSPSLSTLPGQPPSGAHIFYNPSPLMGAPTRLYAPYYALGLQQHDDIDAMIIIDRAGDGSPVPDGIFNGIDTVIFSLAPGSPSLNEPGRFAGAVTAADVLVVQFGQPPGVLAPGAGLGVGLAVDNVDALEFFLCDTPALCAALHGIRALRGDLNCDDLVNAFDIDPFVLALSDPAGYQAAFPDCQIHRADCNRDGVINAFDIDAFVEILTGGP